MKIFTKDQHNKFEQIWIAENKDTNYRIAKKLPDAEYIDYHIWEDINSAEMYKKYFPKAHVMRGNNPNIIFHGGCLGCLSQRAHILDLQKHLIYL